MFDSRNFLSVSLFINRHKNLKGVKKTGCNKECCSSISALFSIIYDNAAFPSERSPALVQHRVGEKGCRRSVTTGVAVSQSARLAGGVELEEMPKLHMKPRCDRFLWGRTDRGVLPGLCGHLLVATAEGRLAMACTGDDGTLAEGEGCAGHPAHGLWESLQPRHAPRKNNVGAGLPARSFPVPSPSRQDSSDPLPGYTAHILPRRGRPARQPRSRRASPGWAGLGWALPGSARLGSARPPLFGGARTCGGRAAPRGGRGPVRAASAGPGLAL